MQKRDSVSVPRDTQKCEQEDWATVSGSERIAPYRLDQSSLESKRTRLGFSQTSIFIQSLQRPHERRPMASTERASFCLVFRSLNTTSSHRMFSMGYRRAKSTQGNTNFQKRIFWQTTPGSLPAGLKGVLQIWSTLQACFTVTVKRAFKLFGFWGLCALRHTSRYPKFNGSHFDWPPSSIKICETIGLGGNFVPTMTVTYSHRPIILRTLIIPGGFLDPRSVFVFFQVEHNCLYFLLIFRYQKDC